MSKDYLKNKLSLLKCIFIVSVLANVMLGVLYFVNLKDSKTNNSFSTSEQEAFSGIKIFKYGNVCNEVFNSIICASDFQGLSEDAAIYLAKIHGLESAISKRENKNVQAFVLVPTPMRIIFNIENKMVVDPTFH